MSANTAMKIIITHPTANGNVRAAVMGLANQKILSAFHTTIATFPGSTLDKISAMGGALSEFKRRSFDKILEPFTKTHPWFELGRMISSKTGLKNLTRHEQGFFSIDSVYSHFDNAIAKGLSKAKKNGAAGVYAYEDGAMKSFTEAKRLGMTCFYDLPIGYWRSGKRLMETELEKWPDWAATLTGLVDSDAKLERKDKELQLADKIFVASSFTATTLKEYPGYLAPVEVIPYGFPEVNTQRTYTSGSEKKKIKILFVGGLSQRKGLAYLFEAIDQFSDVVELTIVGGKLGTDCPVLNANLNKHRWIPSLAHDQILKLMSEQDVFVFPSLFEGFGLVITEAMSQGTPVITTERTAGPDLIEHDKNGWLIEAGSTDALKAAIEKLVINPKLIADAGKQALETAKNRPWEMYGKELAESIIKCA